jgi:tRNA(Ile)-lysidine synthase
MLDRFRWGLLSSGDAVLVAVSGGPDSLSLLHRLWTEREARGIRVEAAHLDHGLRGAESAAEAEWVAAWCAERGIVCHVGREDAAAWASAHKQSPQEAARAVRYVFLERTAASISADKIATGHTRDDQAETVLGHILRGTGVDGLRGIPERRGSIIRPMLGVSRAQVEAYCAAHGLSPRQDQSNHSPDHYTRNRLRLDLLPLLRQGYNPRVDDALVRLSEIAARDSDFLAGQAQAALAGVTRESDAFHVQLDRAALAALHPALLRGVLRLAIAGLRGTGEGISYEHLERVCRAVAEPQRRTSWLTLPYPLCTVRVAEQALTLANAPVSLGYVSAALTVPGAAHLPEIGWVLTASWVETPGAVRLDADAVDLHSLEARNRRSGDKIAPLGMGGRHKKVSDIFTDAKVPRPERDGVPLVADARGIVWVAGHTQSERARITAQTTRVLYLSAEKLAGNGGGNRE